MGGYGAVLRASFSSYASINGDQALSNPSEGAFIHADERTALLTVGASPAKSQTALNSSGRPLQLLSWVQLMGIVYFSVGGGPFGFEQSLRAANPAICFWTLLLLCLTWALPQALYVAELSTRYKRGYNEWVTTGLGPTIGMAHSLLRTFFGIITNAVYLALFIEYAEPFIHSLAYGNPVDSSNSDSSIDYSSLPPYSPEEESSVWNRFYFTWEKGVSIAVYTLIVFVVNIAGVQLVGVASVILVVLVLTPFVIMVVMGFQYLDFSMLVEFPPGKYFFDSMDPSLLVSVMLFNLQGWDFVGNLSSRAKKPQRDVPGGILGALVFLFLTYSVPTFSAASILGPDGSQTSDNLYVDAASVVWQPLTIIVTVAALLGVLGLGCSFLSTSSEALAHSAYFLYAPLLFAKKTKRGDVPIVSVVLHTILMVSLASAFEFDILVQLEMFLLCISTVTIGLAFIIIRVHDKRHSSEPTSTRIFRLKKCFAGIILLPISSIAFSIFGLVVADWQTACISGFMTVVSVVMALLWTRILTKNSKYDFSSFRRLCGGLILLPAPTRQFR